MKRITQQTAQVLFCTLSLFGLTACPHLNGFFYPYPEHRPVVDTADTCEEVECGPDHSCVIEKHTSAASGHKDRRPACVDQ
ncbi:MAG: hypothetical protein CMH56_05300 [Myxococcales bacterium]|nr:hypothetical protein [Myxococcales bacterium]